MKYSNEEIQKKLSDAFKFLIDDYDMQLVSRQNKDWGIKQIYRTEKTAISILFEFREAYVNVLLHRLAKNEIQNDVFPYKKHIPLNNIGLDYIVKYKNPSELTRPLYDEAADYYGKEDAFDIMVSRLASNLQRYGADVLKGNFNIFEEVDEFVKSHYT